MFSTLGGGGGMFSTSEVYHEYIGGISVHRRDIISTSVGYHEYIEGGRMSTLGCKLSTLEGYQIHLGNTMIYVWDFQYIRGIT